MNLRKLLSSAMPWHTLFGKIFLWFWLSSLLIMAITNVVVKSINKPYLLTDPTEVQITTLASHAHRVVDLFDIYGEDVFAELARLNERERIQVYLVDENLTVVGTPRPLRAVFPLLAGLLNQEQPMIGTWQREIWMGPAIIELNGRPFHILLRGIAEDADLPMTSSYSESVIFVIALMLSGLLSAILAWSFSRPLKQFRLASQKLANGTLSTRVGQSLTERLDEFGSLGRDFDHMADRLQNLVSAQQRLLGNVSHELRSPITRIQVALGIAIQKAGPEAENILMRIERETVKLEVMIAQVLRLSRLENQMQDLQKKRIDLNQLLEQLADDADFEARASNKKVVFNPSDNNWVCGESSLLHSAIENVVRNGIRFTQENTTVEISTRSLTFDGCKKVEIIVRDHGPGAPEDMLERLFEPFYRAVDNTSDGGAGLGLSIARQVVTRHGGFISARNHLSGGLEVVIQLLDCQDASDADAPC